MSYQCALCTRVLTGTGGDEAALFCADIFNMYKNLAEVKGAGPYLSSVRLSDRTRWPHLIVCE